MKRRYKATGVNPTKNALNVYVTIEVGTTVRFATVAVPWHQVADHYREVCDGMERVNIARLEADAGVQYLPLEKWE